MMINANRFQFDLKLDGESVFTDIPITLIYILINYDLNSIPKVEIKFTCDSPMNYLKCGDYEISITSDTEWSLTVNAAIYDTRFKSKEVLLYGYLCTYEDLTVVASTYLGDNLTDAIKSLNIRDTITDVDEVSGDYWQLNDTKINTLLKLLNAGKASSVFLIDDTSIKMLDMTKAPDDGISLDFSYSDINFMKSTKYFDDSLIRKHEGETSYTIAWNNRTFIGFEYYTFMENLSTSLKYKLSIDKCIRLRYTDRIIDINLGDILNIKTPEVHSGGLYVLNKIYTFTPLRCDTELIIGM